MQNFDARYANFRCEPKWEVPLKNLHRALVPRHFLNSDILGAHATDTCNSGH